ncbi:MAG TPA: ATP-binding cassette domain-containing protein, partial [Candidatus Tectomicrobia bacterium]
MAHRIVLTDVEAGYGAVRVLHRVSIEVREGETVALLGTNGNGKSTLMKCIMGLVPVDAGEVFLEIDGQ